MQLQRQAGQGFLGEALLQQLAQADGGKHRPLQRDLRRMGMGAAHRVHRSDQQRAEAVALSAGDEAQDGAGADRVALQRDVKGLAPRPGRGHVEPQRQVLDARDAVQQGEVAPARLQRLQVARRVRLAQAQTTAGQGFGAPAEGLQLRAAGVAVDLQQRRPGQCQAVAEQRGDEVLELAAIDRIEEKLVQRAEREVPSDRIGELVMRELKKLDKIAYIRFASVYRNFADVDEFSDVIREVKTPRRRTVK